MVTFLGVDAITIYIHLQLRSREVKTLPKAAQVVTRSVWVYVCLTPEPLTFQGYPSSPRWWYPASASSQSPRHSLHIDPEGQRAGFSFTRAAALQLSYVDHFFHLGDTLTLVFSPSISVLPSSLGISALPPSFLFLALLHNCTFPKEEISLNSNKM